MQDKLQSLKKIDGNTLKIIACVCMLLDHIGAAFIYPVATRGLYPDSMTFDQVKLIYDTFRTIGRMAFPLYCFLLTEGFIHTKSRPRYALSLFLFALISEPFYEVAFHAEIDPFNINMIEVLRTNADTRFENCNAYFSLLIGLLTIWAVDYFMNKAKEDLTWYPRSVSLSVIAAAAGAYLAYRIQCDYKSFGILLIIALYFLRPLEPLNILAGYIILSMYMSEYKSLPAFILMLFYSKKRGRSLGYKKYLFYAFYPLHIFLIYLIRCLIYGT